jgi:hypothetical protein
LLERKRDFEALSLIANKRLNEDRVAARLTKLGQKLVPLPIRSSRPLYRPRCVRARPDRSFRPNVNLSSSSASTLVALARSSNG